MSPPILLFFFFLLIPTHSLTPLHHSQLHLLQQYLRIDTSHPDPAYASAVAFLASIADSIPIPHRTLHLAPSKSKPLLLLSWLGSDPSLPSVLLNSHLDSVPAEPEHWAHPPFAAVRDEEGRVFARGAQDDKCLVVQQLEAIRGLKGESFVPRRTVHVSVVPDEEIGGADGAARFAVSEEFKELNVGFMLDEGQASPTDKFRVFYADRTPWKVILRARGRPGHGAKMFDGSALENLMEAVEGVSRFRDGQFDLVKAGVLPASEVISVNPVYMKAGTPTPTGFQMNMQPSEGEVGFDVRLPPTTDPVLLRKRIGEWAPSTKNMTYEILEKGPIRDHLGQPLATTTNASNMWWSIFEEAIILSGGKLAKPEILASTTDARFMRQMGIPTLGFSPMSNTPILLHEHNEFLQDTVFLKGIEVYKHVIRALSSA